MPGVQLSILAANVSSLLAMDFTHVEIWQSTDLGNSYHEITAATPQPAKLTSLPAATLFRMGGKLLEFVVDGGSEQSVTFSSLIDYWTPTQVANRINEVVASLASVVGNTVVLTSPTTGRASSLLITYSDGADLGFSDGLSAVGLASRQLLNPDTLIYTFNDPIGGLEDRYKWRFSANGVNPISDFSLVVFGKVPALIDSSKLSVCTATFVGLDGTPQQRSVVVAFEHNPISLAGFVIGNKLPSTFQSDAQGFLQFTLVRGTTVKVAIEGTTFVREFVVPDQATFDLLEVMATAPDPFTIQTPTPFLYRRNV